MQGLSTVVGLINPKPFLYVITRSPNPKPDADGKIIGDAIDGACNPTEM